MDNEELRRDPLTGVRSVHPDQRNKPFPVARRTLPHQPGPCVFCALAAAPVDDHGDIKNGDELSHLEWNGEYTFAITNRWRPFGQASGADLVILRRHATSVEEMSDAEIGEFFGALVERRSRQSEEYARTLAYVNVGLEVNGTQPHLHGQIVGTNVESRGPVAPALTRESLDADSALARDHGVTLDIVRGTHVYVAWAPTTTGEVRVVADDAMTLGLGVREVLTKMTAAFGELSYNVVVLTGPQLVAQVLPRFTAVGVLPPYFGLAVVMIPPEDVARSLRDA